MKKRILIMGAAGRDFHNFNMLYRDDPAFEVVCFTATQIPFISDRVYPKELAGGLYPGGIYIHPEEKLAELIKKHRIDEVVFSYSDISHRDVMQRASLCVALNANFTLIGAEKTMLKSSKTVISVSAVRTGCGKSGVTRYIAKTLLQMGKKVVAIRHPMPYGDLTAERVQRFAALNDIEDARCTIEEMEEYEPLVNAGITVFSGVDYAEVLKEAEKEADVIIWDGGNNDLPFIKPDMELTVADPLRAGHELDYFPGEANAIRAHHVIINKCDTASHVDIRAVRDNIKKINQSASFILTASAVTVDKQIHNMKVLVIEDGPTLTHGGMRFGAGIIAAKKYGAHPVDVRDYAVGSIKEALDKYPRIENVLPAIGYSDGQKQDLEETINAVPCDAVLVATPIDISRILKINKPCVRVKYEIKDMDTPGLGGIIKYFFEMKR